MLKTPKNIGEIVNFDEIRSKSRSIDTSKEIKQTFLGNQSLITYDFAATDKRIEFVQNIVERQSVELDVDYVTNKYKISDANVLTIELGRLYNEEAIYVLEEISKNNKIDAFVLPASSQIYTNAPEVLYMRYLAKKLNIPTFRILSNPFDPQIVKLSKMKVRDAIQAIAITEKEKYDTMDPRLLRYLSNKFDIDIDFFHLINKKIIRKVNLIQDYLAYYISLYKDLINTANDYNYDLLKKINLKGNILMIEESSLTQVFDKKFVPQSNICRDKIPIIDNKKVSTFGKRTSVQTANFLFDFDKFTIEYNNLIKHLDSQKWNEFSMRRLERMLLSYYQYFKVECEYKRMLLVAKLMKKHGIQGADSRIRDSQGSIRIFGFNEDRVEEI